MNAYTNQAILKNSGFIKLTVGQKVQTIYGEGTVTNIRGTFHRVNGSNLDPIIATIIIPGNPPIIFEQNFQTLLFTNGINGEVSVTGQNNSNL